MKSTLKISALALTLPLAITMASCSNDKAGEKSETTAQASQVAATEVPTTNVNSVNVTGDASNTSISVNGKKATSVTVAAPEPGQSKSSSGQNSGSAASSGSNSGKQSSLTPPSGNLRVGDKIISNWPEGVELDPNAQISTFSTYQGGGDFIAVSPDPQRTFDQLNEEFRRVGMKNTFQDNEDSDFEGGGWKVNVNLRSDDTVNVTWTHS